MLYAFNRNAHAEHYPFTQIVRIFDKNLPKYWKIYVNRNKGTVCCCFPLFKVKLNTIKHTMSHQIEK